MDEKEWKFKLAKKKTTSQRRQTYRQTDTGRQTDRQSGRQKTEFRVVLFVQGEGR